MPESPIDEATGATLDARTDLDAQEIDGDLDTAEDMDHVFIERPSHEHRPTHKPSDDMAEPRRDSVEENVVDDNDVQLYTEEAAAAIRSSSDEPADDPAQVEISNASIESARLLPVDAQQTHTASGMKRDTADATITAQADQAVPPSASAAALAAAAVSSAVATSTVPTLQIPSGLPAGTPPYPSFAPLAPNGTPMMAHSLVSLPASVGRRAVRIAPMGVLPLPPQSAVPAALVSDHSNSNGSNLLTTSGRDDGGNGEGQISTAGRAVTSTIGDMPKGKRRGVSSSVPISTEGLTPEERTKQKRMLRNRESAARSRDKRKTKNIQLETSIDKHKKKKMILDGVICELQDIVDSMQQELKKHSIPLTC